MSNNNIVVWTLPNCPQCEQTKTYLRLHNMGYVEKDLSTQPASKIEEFKAQGFTSAPIVEAQNRTWSGFNYPNLQEYVKENKQ